MDQPEIIEMPEQQHKHYYRTREDGVIIHAFSDAFEQPQEGDVEAQDSDGGRHFNPDLMNERRQFAFRLEDGKRVPRAQEELDAEWAARPPEPETDAQKIARLEDENAGLMLELAEAAIRQNEAEIRLDAAEQTQADLLLTLVTEGGL